ncbi:hypothetical protein VP01_458g2 [Puccinia sorghi]|uniref:Methyltransferase domain-containing protein n=1 Tax=Puccinia sorghi TaxID=27349 RepID=A0A0L6UNK9_9BASI|nr:hypothetical protein VP01_458g2 [Puccinia sorghi]
MAAYLQETYLFQEPDDHEVIKHDRAHHRNFKGNNPSPQEFSRIRRLLKKSTPSRRSTVDTDPDIHAELSFKGPISFPNYTPSLDCQPPLIEPSPKPRSRFISRSSHSLVGRCANEWLTLDITSSGAGKPSMRRAVLDAAYSSDSHFMVVKGPSGSKIPHRITPLPSNNNNNNNNNNNAGSQASESTQSSLSSLAHESHPRKPRLSISKSFIQTCVSNSKSPSLSLAFRPDAASQTSLSYPNHIMMQYAAAILQGSSPFELTFNLPSATNKSISGVRRVLDIGCGPSATWCVGVLRETSGVQVTALDICPLQLDLGCLEKSVSSNLSFVQHNFLTEPLPFDTASFDYVHASFISNGVPEHHWTHLVEEMARVLSRHGALEILDCNTSVADPLKARASKQTDLELLQSSGSRCRVPNASGSSMTLNTSTLPEAHLGKESSLKLPPKTVNEMVHKLLEQRFISPYPLSILPTEVSGVTTAMRRPLAKQSIRFPSDLQSFVDTQAKSPDRASSRGSDTPRPTTIAVDDPSVKAAAAECMGMLLLHSHIDAMYSNKEICWHDLWLPSISCETVTSVPATSAPRIRPSQSRMPNHIGRHFQPTRRNKLILPTRNPMKSKHNKGANLKPSPRPTTANQHDGLNSPGIPQDGIFLEKIHSRSQSNLYTNAGAGSSTFDVLPDQKESIHPQHLQHEQLSCINAPRDSSTEIFTHRKNFDQIWNGWKDDLNRHSVGISKLLELRFGWTCTMDIEHHEALHEHYEYYQYELAQCESRINELRHKLQETSGVGSSLDQEPPLPLTLSSSSEVNSASPRCTQWLLQFESETSFDENEDFEHVNLAAAASHNDSSGHPNSGTLAGADARQRLASLESPASRYGNNLMNHEMDSQSLEELGFDTLREKFDLRDENGERPAWRMRRSSGSLGRLSCVGLHRVRSPHPKFSRTSSMREPAESDHDSGASVYEPELVPLRRNPSWSKVGNSDRASIKEDHKKEEQLQQHAEIETLSRQKAEIKKAIQLIQTDLDNLTKRLALSGPDDHPISQQQQQPSPAGHPPLSIQTIFQEKGAQQMCVASEDDRAAHSRSVEEESSGTLEDVFTPLDRIRFSFLLGDGRLISPTVFGSFFQDDTRNNIRPEHDLLTSRIPTLYGGSPPPTLSSFPTIAPNNPSTNHLPIKESRFTTAGFGDLKIESRTDGARVARCSISRFTDTCAPSYAAYDYDP